MDQSTERKGIHRGLVASLILGLAIATPLFPPSTALVSSASAVSATKGILIETYELCVLPPPTTTTTSAPMTTTSVPNTGTTTTVPSIAPYFMILGPPPMFFSLTQRGHIVTSTGLSRFRIPPSYKNFGHPQGRSGFDARFVLRAPPGTYVLHGFSVRRVTLVAGRITRVNVRQGNCW